MTRATERTAGRKFTAQHGGMLADAADAYLFTARWATPTPDATRSVDKAIATHLAVRRGDSRSLTAWRTWPTRTVTW